MCHNDQDVPNTTVHLNGTVKLTEDQVKNMMKAV